MRKKPVVLSTLPARPSVSAGNVGPPKLWTFGFRFFRQIEHFGLDRTNAECFVSLLEKLRAIGDEVVDDFLEDGGKKEYWRFHPINWNQHHIPIKKEVLSWLPADILNNPAEFPIQQFQVSLSLGRVVGFIDEHQVFQIVLLDPWHNIQPARSHNYRVDPCSPLSCEYTRLREDVVMAAQGAVCVHTDTCPVREALQKVDAKPDRAYDVIIIRPDEESMKNATDLVKNGTALSYEDLFLTGVIATLDKS